MSHRMKLKGRNSKGLLYPALFLVDVFGEGCFWISQPCLFVGSFVRFLLSSDLTQSGDLLRPESCTPISREDNEGIKSEGRFLIASHANNFLV